MAATNACPHPDDGWSEQSRSTGAALHVSAASPSSAALEFKLPPRPSTVFLAGLTSGVAVAGLFNPFDRALYLSVLHTRPFLQPVNWSNPYTGFLQSLLGRTLSGGLYFPLYDLCVVPLQKHVGFPSSISCSAHFLAGWLLVDVLVVGRPLPVLNRDIVFTLCVHLAQGGFAPDSALLAFLAGNAAGAANGIVLNHLTTVKYQSWKTGAGFVCSARSMFQQGGVRPFMKGIGATMTRDVGF